jgi:catechol 2,3-dioxygenase-like lactoylglutathione lyase family enzyme
MKMLIAVLIVLGLGASPHAQLSAPNAAGASMGHLHYHVRDVEANRKSFAKVEEAGFTVQRLAQFPGVGSVNTPEGERIELFENTATNLTFTLDSGGTDALAERHNRPLPIPIAFHHIHLYVP